MNNLEWISTSRVYTDEQNEQLIDLTSTGKEKLTFLRDSLAHASPDKFVEALQSKGLESSLRTSLAFLQSSPDTFLPSLSLLFSRIGYEVGFIKRLFD